MLALSIVYFLIVIIILASLWKIYEKAGQEGWAGIIPVYNLVILVRIIGKPTWWVIMMLIPFVNIVFLIMAMNLLAKSFGKDNGFTLGLVFFPYVFYPILGFGDAKYLGPQSKEALLEKQISSL